MYVIPSRDTAILVVLACAAFLVASRLAHHPGPRRIQSLIDRGWALPIASGITVALVYGWVWGGWPSPAPVVHDEAAYLFQAELFATLRWVAPPPVVPMPFTQFHILVEPHYASKYPPGHSLLLAAGAVLGLPGLVPLILSGLAAAVLAALVRRVAGGGAAVLAITIWIGTSLNLQWRPSYFSQLSTSFICIAAWYCLLRWHHERQDGWLALLGMLVGWGAITRPLTMLAYTIPIGLLLLYQSVRTRKLRLSLIPTVCGTVILLILPLWAHKTTGDWRAWPTTTYTMDYMPFDRLGFGLDSSPARKLMPQQMNPLLEMFRELHEEHTPGRFAGSVGERLTYVVRESWSGWRGWLLPIGLIGLVSLGGIAFVAGGGAALHLASYGFYAHPPDWTVYYLEIGPLAAAVTAIGLVQGASWISRQLLENSSERALTIATVVALVVSAAGASLTWAELTYFRSLQNARRAPNNSLSATVEALPDEKRIIVVRYDPTVVPHTTIVANQPWLDQALTWFVHEDARGLAQLVEMAPDRSVYLLEISTWTLRAVQVEYR